MMRPVVGITACYREEGEVGSDCVLRKYTDAVSDVAGCLPLAIPTLGAALDVDALLAAVDGLVFTGSSSNVAPPRYGGPPAPEGVLQDPRRDATALPLLRRAVDAGTPLFALCRGHQELNVAYGGTLHPRVDERAGTVGHAEDTSVPDAERYGPAHLVRLTPRGYLTELLGTERIEVNSLHTQAVDRLAPGLFVEATAPDGVVEAVRVEDARRFALGVQWHPEWRASEVPSSRRLFRAFADACRERMAERLGRAIPPTPAGGGPPR